MLGLSCSSLKAGRRQWSSRGKVNLGPSSEIVSVSGRVTIGDLTARQSSDHQQSFLLILGEFLKRPA